MSDSFVIQWKSKINGRAGRGSRTFSREDGEQVTRELNAEYPEITHELVSISTLPGQPDSADSVAMGSAEPIDDEIGDGSEGETGDDDEDQDLEQIEEDEEEEEEKPKAMPQVTTESEPAQEESLEP